MDARSGHERDGDERGRQDAQNVSRAQPPQAGKNAGSSERAGEAQSAIQKIQATQGFCPAFHASATVRGAEGRKITTNQPTNQPTNQRNNMKKAMTVSDLIEMLRDFDEDAEVHIAYDYGDHWRTRVAPAATEVEEERVTFSDYHRMDKVAGFTGRKVVVIS
jgi:hypothetical protein